MLRSFYVAIFQSKRAGCLLESISIPKIHIALEKAGITYRTKARDLSSPSLFSMGTRERAGTAFQKVNYQNALYDICSQSRLRTCCSRYSCLIKYEHSIQLRLLFMVQCLCQNLLKKIAYWALVLTLVVAEIGSFFDLFNINPWCYPVYAALLILYNKIFLHTIR